ncbi:Ferroporti-1 [Catenaria anguillulae PL171]|uniref:Solute carrier family 40 member n=1 Tax=Catenaria anguillulae PL171 TaxID=765915 RepID=A0A1Y2HMI7_9FUNG|nr:Ferroporti-1 [Catenaria anguillulae PL171]
MPQTPSPNSSARAAPATPPTNNRLARVAAASAASTESSSLLPAASAHTTAAGKGLPALFAAHTLETWTSRTWEFAWPIWIAQLVPDSLAPLSVYGITMSLGALLMGGRIGAMIDRPTVSRWMAVSYTVVIAKLAMAMACSVMMVWFSIAHDPQGWIAQLVLPLMPATELGQRVVLMVPLVIAGLFIKWSNTGYVISVERDWVVVINHGNPLKLAWTNGWVRRIDLLCKLLAPLVIASLIAYLPSRVTVLGLGAWALIDMALELVLFNSVRRLHLPLSLPKSSAAAHAGLEEHNVPAAHSDDDDEEADDSQIALGESGYGATTGTDAQQDRATPSPPSPTLSGATTTLTSPTRSDHHNRSALARYWHHPVLLASLAMASLYVTVLSFGGQMIAYLATEAHVSTQAIAGYRAFAGISGVLATWVAPALITRYGPIRSGLWSIWTQTLCLAPVAIILLRDLIGGQDTNGPVIVTVLCVSVSISRIFLWTFDLSHAQIMQEAIDSHEVGVINGVHYALCAGGDLLTYVLTLVWSSPSDFVVPMLVSVAFVLNGAVLWSVYTYKVRKHLIHWEKVPFLWQRLRLIYAHPTV